MNGKLCWEPARSLIFCLELWNWGSATGSQWWRTGQLFWDSGYLVRSDEVLKPLYFPPSLSVLWTASGFSFCLKPPQGAQIPSSLENPCNFRVFWGNVNVNRWPHFEKRTSEIFLRIWNLHIYFFEVSENYLWLGEDDQLVTNLIFICVLKLCSFSFTYFLWIWSSTLNLNKIFLMSPRSACVYLSFFSWIKANCWKDSAISLYSCWFSIIMELSPLAYIR